MSCPHGYENWDYCDKCRAVEDVECLRERIAELEEQLAAAVAIEREACAAIADRLSRELCDPFCCRPLAEQIAQEIRERS